MGPDDGSNWECPYCRKAQVVLSARRSRTVQRIWNDASEHGKTAYVIDTVACANNECQKLSFWLSIQSTRHSQSSAGFQCTGTLFEWQLLPESSAKALPEFIPNPLREDYYESCRIRDLSPKASATLARRCLQGMIRDFCGIVRKRLVDEIRDLRKATDAGSAPRGVQPDTIDAIDHVRSIGNIGAHMEADIDVIVEVDPDEAQRLIELLELLFDEWYVARHARAEKLAAIGVIALEKAQAKLPPPIKELPAPE